MLLCSLHPFRSCKRAIKCQLAPCTPPCCLARRSTHPRNPLQSALIAVTTPCCAQCCTTASLTLFLPCCHVSRPLIAQPPSQLPSRKCFHQRPKSVSPFLLYMPGRHRTTRRTWVTTSPSCSHQCSRPVLTCRPGAHSLGAIFETRYRQKSACPRRSHPYEVVSTC